jgi:hypothetical protein
VVASKEAAECFTQVDLSKLAISLGGQAKLVLEYANISLGSDGEGSLEAGSSV